MAGYAVIGAICASLSDQPGRPWPSARRTAFGGAVGVACSALALPLRDTPAAMAAAIAATGFGATMLLAWGPRAMPVAMAAVLAPVFTMGLPDAAAPADVVLAQAAGAALYWLWALATGALLQRRWRVLALSAAVAASAALLRTRARVLAGTTGDGDTPAFRGWLRCQADLADRLQAARDLIFAAPPGPDVERQTAVLLRLVDLRDLLLVSGLDIDRVPAADALRLHWSQRLAALASALENAAAPLTGRRQPPAQVSGDWPAPGAHAHLQPALQRRLERLQSDIARIAALARGGTETLPLPRAELRRYVADSAWPLSALRSHRTLRSPVLRHALRTALALPAAYGVALLLPWASHPQWLVLSVALVLRGTLDQTLSRRDARVLGTVLGCALVLMLAPLTPAPLLALVFAAAVGVAHGYALQNYAVTAAAASVMALLQAHLVAPGTGFPVAERAADTVIGAALAWAFSYVLPAWERRSLPAAIDRTLAALRAYAAQVLSDRIDAAAQRLARRGAHDSVLALAATLQRGAAEPAAVRPPLAELARLIDQVQRLLAHLSLLRLMLARPEAPVLQADIDATRAAVDAVLQTDVAADLPPVEPLPQGHAITDWLRWRLRVTRRNAADAAAAARETRQALS